MVECKLSRAIIYKTDGCQIDGLWERERDDMDAEWTSMLQVH